MNTLSRFRYWLEIIALPVFLFLVIHLAGHGITIFLQGESPSHDHVHHLEESISAEDHGEKEPVLEKFFNEEVLSGILLMILFVWIWHRPALKKWIPCAHDHCHHHHDGKTPHILAIVALCLHFFPEAGARQALLQNFHQGEIITLLGLIGFAAHFLVDVIVAVLISSYWKTFGRFWLSLGIITAFWFTALFFGQYIIHHIPPHAEGSLFLVSAFLLAMFIHMPHRPIQSCHHCE
ncbi:hypothetical protein K9M59_02960 [Candidatus Gracilibacteria bacterium]|nr:hypothetical protein [Candidatus Gracilibacteria bacterium]MCF7819291.1 hypothetical protein [Candidatus Gracilibacteria bacterium]